MVNTGHRYVLGGCWCLEKSSSRDGELCRDSGAEPCPSVYQKLPLPCDQTPSRDIANRDCCGHRHHHPHEHPACDRTAKVEGWKRQVPSRSAARVPSPAVPASPVLWWHLPRTTRGNNALQPGSHHVPTDGRVVCGGYSSHTRAVSPEGCWPWRGGSTGAQERHSSASGIVLCRLGTEAPLPGFCLERTRAKPTDNWEPVCASGDVSMAEAVHTRDNMWKAARQFRVARV